MAVDIIARALGGNALGQTSKIDEKIVEKLEELGFVTLLYTDDEHAATDENGNPIAYDVAAFVRIDEKGAPNGVATLDADGKVPEEQIPGGGGGGLPAVPTVVNGTYTLTATVTDGEVSYDWQSAIGNERLIVECEMVGQLDEHTWYMSASHWYGNIISAIEAGREVVVRFQDDNLDGRTVELKLDSYDGNSVIFGRVLPSYIGATAVMVEFPSDAGASVMLTYVYGE